MPSVSRFFRCVSIPHGGACPRNFHVDLTSARGHATLGVPAPEPQAGLGRDCGRSFAALPGATAKWDTASTGARCCAAWSSRCMTTRRRGLPCCAFVATSRARTARYSTSKFPKRLPLPTATARPNCWRCLNSVKTCWHAERREQSQRSRSSLSSRGFKSKLKALEVRGSCTEARSSRPLPGYYMDNVILSPVGTAV